MSCSGEIDVMLFTLCFYSVVESTFLFLKRFLFVEEEQHQKEEKDSMKIFYVKEESSHQAIAIT